jgi:agmatinase
MAPRCRVERRRNVDAPEGQALRYPFAGIPTVLRAAIQTKLAHLDADIAIVGIPTDEGSPFLPGSRLGPRGIREHSLRFGPEGFYDQRDGREYLAEELRAGLIVDTGDVDVLTTAVELTFENTTARLEGVLDTGALPVVIGGDHSISYPVVRAFREPLHVVHFDAHIDYSPFMHGFTYTNMHAFRHIRQLDHVEGLTQVGIRSLRNSRVAVDDSLGDGNKVVGMQEFRDIGPRAIAESLPKDAAIYVSIDIDVLDLSLVPGCVSAEPDGLLYAELRDSLVALAEHAQVVGFDLVEVNPLLDVGTGVTSYLAAHTMIEFLGHICAQPRWIARRAERAQRRGRADVRRAE